jgi:ABC-type phosphate transport system auxiliary subunit
VEEACRELSISNSRENSMREDLLKESLNLKKEKEIIEEKYHSLKEETNKIDAYLMEKEGIIDNLES